ncbi:EF-hand calcium-binding domain-containing protein 6 [Desmophyllum pertusum]|uniref:EF-hand calcium-binding domain-containing protein 6 n=1 Tax=Desmophyllum pertusum TaxID=174260 RepID=A0A9W9YI67_9CNID|nr:EF-hand calcium-binding domain-containing protein 6 [Desmophyllum pertusum]
MPVKVQNLVPMSHTNRNRTQVAWSDSKRANEAINAVVGKIRNQMISDWKGLRRAFKKLDLLGDGSVSVTDFKAALNKFSFPLNEEDFFHIFSVFDENMEGRISYVEFMRRSLSE